MNFGVECSNCLFLDLSAEFRVFLKPPNWKEAVNMRTLFLASAVAVVSRAAIVADEVTELNGWSPKPLVSVQ